MAKLNQGALMIEIVRERMRSACSRSGRKIESVLLLAASKTRSIEDIEKLHALGQNSFGENYVQEAIGKIEKLHDKKIDWHFIGTLQSNKAKYIPGNFSLFHGLDSLRLAQKINAASLAKGLKSSALIEVNLGGQLSKGGVSPFDVPYLLESMNSLSHIQIQGLMCIPDPESQMRDPRRNFAKLRMLLEQMNNSSSYKQKLTTLSMGMTLDFEEAILEGATIIRIGTALFGERISDK